MFALAGERENFADEFAREAVEKEEEKMDAISKTVSLLLRL